MSKQKIKTRVQNKHDVAANWSKATSFIPLAGELVIYDEDSTYTYKRFKIGDGVLQADGTVVGTTVNDLPFLHTLRSDGDITVNATTGAVSVKDDSHTHDGRYYTESEINTKLNSVNASIESLGAGKADKTHGIHYIEGTGSTAGTWLGTHADITEYYAGLILAYKIGVAGLSDGTTLNINNLGAVTVVKNATSAISTNFAVNSVIFLVYTVDSDGTAYWKAHDYDSNTKTTTGTSNKESKKLYLAGATSQSSSGATTYSNKNVYIGTNNRLYDTEGIVASDADLAGHTHTVSHTPAGTVSTPTITVTPNTTTVNSITAVGTLPSLTYEEVAADNITAWSAGSGSASLTGSVSSGPNRTVTLTLSHTHTAPSLTYSEVKPHKITAWSAGTLPTKGSNTTVVTSIKSATSTQPSFTGTAATLTTGAANY
jgi:hypothetical protein